MELTRRAAWTAGAAAGLLGFGGRAEAQTRPPKTLSGPFGQVQAYSDERGGVSVLIQQGRRLVFEAYSNGGGPTIDWPIASGTKSFSAVLACHLAREGWLDLDAPCADILGEWAQDSQKATITARQLLNLTSGVVSGGFGAPTSYAAAASAPLQTPPGRHFEYGPGPFQVWGEMVRRMLFARRYDQDVLGLMRSRVLDPAGMREAGWARLDGQPTLASGARLTARQWARWGRWVLDGAGGADLTPCFTGSAANPGYGMGFWLLRPGMIAPTRMIGMSEDGEAMAYQGEDVRLAAGAGEQKLYLLPERDLLIVRQSRGYGAALRGYYTDWSDTEFLRRILAVLPERRATGDTDK